MTYFLLEKDKERESYVHIVNEVQNLWEDHPIGRGSLNLSHEFFEFQIGLRQLSTVSLKNVRLQVLVDLNE